MTKTATEKSAHSETLAPAPLNHGLTVALAPASELHHLRDTLEREYATGKHHSKGVKTMPCKVHALYGGGNAAEKAKQYAMKMAPKNSLKFRSFYSKGDARNFEFWSNEGQQSILAMSEEISEGLVTFQADGIPAVLVPAVLQKLRSAGRAMECSFLLLMDRPEGISEGVVRDNCDHLLIGRKAEADPDAEKAFVIEDAEQDLLSFAGESRVMCQIYKREDGLLERRFSPYVKDSLRDRFLWELRGHGYQQAQLAQAWGVDPSTISRDLKSMPRVVPGSRPMDAERMQMLADHLGIVLPDLNSVKSTDDPAALPTKREGELEDEDWSGEDVEVSASNHADGDGEHDDFDFDAPKTVVNQAPAKKTIKGRAPSGRVIRTKRSTQAKKKVRGDD